jgi:hypothetical protein
VADSRPIRTANVDDDSQGDYEGRWRRNERREVVRLGFGGFPGGAGRRMAR